VSVAHVPDSILCASVDTFRTRFSVLDLPDRPIGDPFARSRLKIVFEPDLAEALAGALERASWLFVYVLSAMVGGADAVDSDRYLPGTAVFEGKDS